MKKFFILLFSGILALGCRSAAVLPPEGWDPEVYEALEKVLTDRSNRGGYAVFDCDNTSIRHDVTHTLMLYLVENLLFADAADHCFMDGLPDPDRELTGYGITAREMGETLRDEFRSLRRMLDDGMPLEEIHRQRLYLDYRARFLAFYKAVGEVYDYGSLCLWEPGLLARADSAEAVDIARNSIRYWLSQGGEWEEIWVSPDGRFTGKAEKGLIVPQHVKNLYAALAKQQIRPYIVSASMEWLVELLACDPQTGFGIDPSQVYGIRLSPGAVSYTDDDPQPFKEGKVWCIREKIAPQHGGREPVLAAGDSEGDVAMLTAWPSLKMGLIMDCVRGGEIDSLGRGGGKYFLQTGSPESRLRGLIAEMPARAGGCYHSYEVDPDVDTPAPEGYKAFYISHYGRHGSRYHTPVMVSRSYPQDLLRADSLGMLTPVGKQVLERIREVRKAHEGHEGDLAPRGAREHRGLAERMLGRFPEVFAGRDSVRAVATHYPRCEASMAAFLEGLGPRPVSASSGERYFDLLSHKFVGQKDFFAEVSQRQWTMRDERIDPSAMQGRLFQEGFRPDSIQRVLKSIYVLGCQEEDLDFPEEGRLFGFFTPEELFDQWTIYSDVVYGEIGGNAEYGERIVPVAKDLLLDVIGKADQAVGGNDVAADLRFGHDNGLVPLLSLMGVEGYAESLPIENSWKRWASFERIPMASNLQMVFYRNDAGDVLVKLLFNERETRIPALESVSGPYYSWSSLRDYWLQCAR